MVEQKARQCLAMADYGYVLDRGGTGSRARPRRCSTDPEVVRLYLGAAVAAARRSAMSPERRREDSQRRSARASRPAAIGSSGSASASEGRRGTPSVLPAAPDRLGAFTPAGIAAALVRPLPTSAGLGSFRDGRGAAAAPRPLTGAALSPQVRLCF